MKCTIPLVLIVAVLMVSCGKSEDVRVDAPQPPQTQSQGTNMPTTALPDRPAPDVPKEAVGEYPKPGQTNNHSSPGFKGGTAADSK